MTIELQADPFERRALELAWRSCRAGTVGVGALLVDDDGTIMAEGNNAIFTPADAGPLTGSRVAHAEMNVFAQIPGAMRPRGATLYTSLEPCAMCAGAIVIHGLKAVRILTDDPIMNGLEAMVEGNEFVRKRWAPRTYCDDPTTERLASLFAAHHYFSTFDERHHYVSAFTAAKPGAAQWIAELVSIGTMRELIADDADLSQVIEAVF